MDMPIKLILILMLNKLLDIQLLEHMFLQDKQQELLIPAHNSILLDIQIIQKMPLAL